MDIFRIDMLLSEFAKTHTLVSDVISADQLLNYLWYYCNDLIIAEKMRCGLDDNAQGKVLLWTIVDDMPEWRKQHLADINIWSDASWMIYWGLRPRVELGEDVELPNSLPESCPWTFRELLFEK
jgi:hypothetical protein